MRFELVQENRYVNRKNIIVVSEENRCFRVSSLNGSIRFNSQKDFQDFALLLEKAANPLVEGWCTNSVRWGGSIEIQRQSACYMIRKGDGCIYIPKHLLVDFIRVCQKFSKRWWSYYINRGRYKFIDL